jgi:hypothetical protein
VLIGFAIYSYQYWQHIVLWHASIGVPFGTDLARQATPAAVTAQTAVTAQKHGRRALHCLVECVHAYKGLHAFDRCPMWIAVGLALAAHLLYSRFLLPQLA